MTKAVKTLKLNRPAKSPAKYTDISVVISSEENPLSFKSMGINDRKARSAQVAKAIPAAMLINTKLLNKSKLKFFDTFCQNVVYCRLFFESIGEVLSVKRASASGFILSSFLYGTVFAKN